MTPAPTPAQKSLRQQLRDAELRVREAMVRVRELEVTNRERNIAFDENLRLLNRVAALIQSVRPLVIIVAQGDAEDSPARRWLRAVEDLLGHVPEPNTPTVEAGSGCTTASPAEESAGGVEVAATSAAGSPT